MHGLGWDKSSAWKALSSFAPVGAQEAGLRVLEEGGAPPSSDDEGEQKGLLAGRATAS